MLERRETFWFVALLIALLFSVTNLPWTLDDYDQAKQAFTSFEMVQEGHWLYQHTPNERIATKPPLVGWVSAACYAVTRSWEVSWRLPSLAAALLLLVALTRTAKQAYGMTAGLVAMAAFGLNLLSPRLATLVRTDMPLALVVFLLGWKIWEKVRSADPWLTRDRFMMFALLTVAMLIKGPVVYAFLLPGTIVFQWSNRGVGTGGSAWCGWWPWLASLGVFLLWAGSGIVWVPQFYERVVLREFFGRFGGDAAHLPQPFYFYGPHLLHKFAPWSLLMIYLAVLGWKTHRTTLRERWRNLAPEMAWLVCWSLGGLLVMSLIPSKRVDRIYPIVPPLCLLLAAQFGQLSRDKAIGPAARRWTVVAVIFACFFSGGYAMGKAIAGYRSGDAALVNFGAAVRKEAVAQGWSYEVIGGMEEGLLLYLRRPHFIKRADAIERWKAGSLDAVVAPAEESGELLQKLPGSAPSGLEASITINGQRRPYVLLKKDMM